MNKLIHLKSNYVVKAPREEVYKIITDFENMPKYFPSVAKSVRFINRDGNNFTVEAKTKAFFGSKTFTVRMEGQFRPPEGFVSTNTSSLGIDHEVFTMEEIPEGTRIHYVNDVEIKSPFFRLFGSLIRAAALRYWKRGVFDKLRQMLEKDNEELPAKEIRMIFKNASKGKKVLFIVFAAVLFCGACFFVWYNFSNRPEPVSCPQKAKLCLDGSYVRPTGHNCEFAKCPPEENLIVSDFGNKQVEKAVTDYLLTQKHFSWKTKTGSNNFCVIENLDPENELFPLYVWAYCGEFIVQNGVLKELSGISGPVKIDYPNELSFYDLSRFSYEAPGDGSLYSEDIKKIFPEDVQQRIIDFDRLNIIKRIEATAIINNTSWEAIKQAIDNCEVKEVWQTHDRAVTAKLKNGKELTAVEPQLDEVMIMAESAEAKCGKILTGTE